MVGYYVQHPNKITNASSRDISGFRWRPCHGPLPTHCVQNIIIHATLMSLLVAIQSLWYTFAFRRLPPDAFRGRQSPAPVKLVLGLVR